MFMLVWMGIGYNKPTGCNRAALFQHIFTKSPLYFTSEQNTWHGETCSRPLWNINTECAVHLFRLINSTGLYSVPVWFCTIAIIQNHQTVRNEKPCVVLLVNWSHCSQAKGQYFPRTRVLKWDIPLISKQFSNYYNFLFIYYGTTSKAFYVTLWEVLYTVYLVYVVFLFITKPKIDQNIDQFFFFWGGIGPWSSYFCFFLFVCV